MLRLNFREQINRCLSIDRIVKAGDRLQCFDIDRTINIQSLTAAIGFEFFFLAFLNPTVGGDTVVLRMGGIREIDRIIFALSGLKGLIFFNKSLLLCSLLFARYMRRLLVGKVQSMQ